MKVYRKEYSSEEDYVSAAVKCVMCATTPVQLSYYKLQIMSATAATLQRYSRNQAIVYTNT
jgi:hypothetical protein